MRLKCIIPSKDRACQLNLLLDSIRKNWDINLLDIEVLYQATNDKFMAGYNLLREKYNLVFTAETNFAEQIRRIVLGSDRYICFFTDDCVFYRPSTVNPITILDADQDILSFNFRLGDNTIIQNYLTGETQIPLRELGYKYIDQETIKWRWKTHPAHFNYGYLFSWDGCVYRKDFIYGAIKDVNFNNPRTMEGNVAGNLNKRNSVGENYMAAPLISNVVVNTVNKVQDFGPEAGVFHNYSVEDLNEKYLSGRIISLDGFDFDNIISSHIELPLVFEEYK